LRSPLLALLVVMTVEDCAANSDSKPRAEDLSATCCSMAESGVEPDAGLWTRMRAIRDGLREPW
jgi:hypothetical protein